MSISSSAIQIRMTNVLTDWLTDWLTDKCTDWLTDWLTDWQMYWLTDWLTDWLSACASSKSTAIKTSRCFNRTWFNDCLKNLTDADILKYEINYLDQAEKNSIFRSLKSKSWHFSGRAPSSSRPNTGSTRSGQSWRIPEGVSPAFQRHLWSTSVEGCSVNLWWGATHFKTMVWNFGGWNKIKKHATSWNHHETALLYCKFSRCAASNYLPKLPRYSRNPHHSKKQVPFQPPENRCDFQHGSRWLWLGTFTWLRETALINPSSCWMTHSLKQCTGWCPILRLSLYPLYGLLHK